MIEMIPVSELFKRGARPAMMWVSLVLVPVAVIWPGVGADKLVPLLTFLAAVYGIRGWEKVKQNARPE